MTTTHTSRLSRLLVIICRESGIFFEVMRMKTLLSMNRERAILMDYRTIILDVPDDAELDEDDIFALMTDEQKLGEPEDWWDTEHVYFSDDEARIQAIELLDEEDDVEADYRLVKDEQGEWKLEEIKEGGEK